MHCGPGTFQDGGECQLEVNGATSDGGFTLPDAIVVTVPTGLTCGTGTEAVDGSCVPTGTTPGPSLTCGAGTSDVDGSCVPTPAVAPFLEMNVTRLEPLYDTAQPVFVGHRLPIRVGITGTPRVPAPSSGDGGVAIGDGGTTAGNGTGRTRMALNVSLVQAFPAGTTPSEADEEAQQKCFVGTVDVEMQLDGEEQIFEPVIEIPEECFPAGSTALDYNVAIQLDYNETALPADAVRGFIFSPAHRTEPHIVLCRPSADPPSGGTVGPCADLVYRVQASPGDDVDEAIEPDSRIALFWPGASGTEAMEREMLSLGVDRRVYGPDPFSVLDDAHGDRLPGIVTQQVRITPAFGDHAGEWQPLQISASTGEGTADQFDHLSPNVENRVTYDLFPTQTVLDLVTTGAWSNVEEFTVEACVQPAFTEQGETGGMLEEDQEPGDGGTGTTRTPTSNDCKRFGVLGVRAQLPTTTAASEQNFTRTWDRRWGNDNIAANLAFSTQNYLDIGAAVTDTNGRAFITSKYLPEITLADAKARAAFDLYNPGSSGIDLHLDVFGVRLIGYQRSVPESAQLFVHNWNYMQEFCRETIVNVGPIPVTLEGCVSGTLGLEVSLGLYRDNAVTPSRRFPARDTEGQIAAQARPYIEIGGAARVSLDALVIRAGVEGVITIIGISAPVTAGLNVGLTRRDPAFQNRSSAQIGVSLNWSLVLQALTGQVSLFADHVSGVKWCAFIPCGRRWSRLATFTLFSFEAYRHTIPLYDYSFLNVTLSP